MSQHKSVPVSSSSSSSVSSSSPTSAAALPLVSGAAPLSSSSAEIEALVAAAGKGEIGEVKRLLSQKVPVSGKANNGYTALLRAAYQGHRPGSLSSRAKSFFKPTSA